MRNQLPNECNGIEKTAARQNADERVDIVMCIMALEDPGEGMERFEGGGIDRLLLEADERYRAVLFPDLDD